MEKSLQLIADLAKLFNWATRMNSIPKAAGWLEIQMEMEQQRPGWPPKNSQGAWKLPFPGWGDSLEFSPLNLTVQREKLLRAIYHWCGWGSTKPSRIFWLLVSLQPPPNPKTQPKGSTPHSPSCTEGFFTETKQTQDFCEEAQARPKPEADLFRQLEIQINLPTRSFQDLK